ncbi:pyridoxamine 5'-phosphate oxidase [Paracandidimonas soli]|uniref:Pyridoxine/pyridoxamine 5'-phosphate oxidase n=1 Tax=Paracandidimonas soli TaxID=1917182 RepID=A0A4R3V2N1_9BURK|nr:pyridoxamine 5'-phosphate oxidase [Paracandidimonas soli]TCU99045.1 pyridoxamine 5'-phosphate oxidase [Paracandidimonas soli]
MSVADIRHDYSKNELLESSLADDPFRQFDAWFEEALAAKVSEVNAMTLASADAKGRPSARIVLLKGYDERGFVFFTNYDSRKGHDLQENPQASLLFFWPALERQVRIEGSVSRTSEQESDEYFHSRPLGSRIGAWASPQSRPITREALEANTASLGESLGEHPQRPEHWGGFRLAPERLEFWQGRPSRLHDRLVYERNAEGLWLVSRLAP